MVFTASGLFTAQLMLSNPKNYKYKIVWEKSKPTNFLNAKRQPLRKHEDIVVFYRKQPTYNPQMTKGKAYNKGVRKNQLTGSYGKFNPVLQYCATQNPKNLKTISDVGSGLNDHRKGLMKLLSLVFEDKVDRIFISYKDRLTRFGFNYLQAICDFHHTEIVIVSTETQDKTVEYELAEDIISIIHSFSGKLYDLRKKVREQVDKELKDE